MSDFKVSVVSMNGKTGLYLVTEIDEKWWQRYTEDKFMLRGNGKYWYDDNSFYFLRYLSKEPINIPFENISEFKIGTWHSGKWCFGYPILKIIWIKDGVRLSSGFLVSKNKEEVNKLISELKTHI